MSIRQWKQSDVMSIRQWNQSDLMSIRKWNQSDDVFFTHYAVVKARVAFFSGGDVSDTCDEAKTSKCHGLRPLYKGWKVSISTLKCQPSQRTPQKSPTTKQPRTSTDSLNSIHLVHHEELVQQEVQTFYCQSSPKRINGCLNNPARCCPWA